MSVSEAAAAAVRTALEQLISEGELDGSWTATADFSMPSQSHTALFRRLDPSTQVETAEITVDFDPNSPEASQTIKDHVYEWVEMSGGR